VELHRPPIEYLNTALVRADHLDAGQIYSLSPTSNTSSHPASNSGSPPSAARIEHAIILLVAPLPFRTQALVQRFQPMILRADRKTPDTQQQSGSLVCTVDLQGFRTWRSYFVALFLVGRSLEWLVPKVGIFGR
jgi:hypothetical protein